MPQRPSDGVAPGLPEAGPQHLEALQQVGTGLRKPVRNRRYSLVDAFR